VRLCELEHEMATDSSEAYQILSNSDSRAFYDKVGKDGMKRPEEGGEVDPQEIFSKMFGGGESPGAFDRGVLTGRGVL